MKRQGLGLHDDQHAFATKYAKDRKITFSQAVREIMQAGIDALKKVSTRTKRT